jgi:vacuolar-type H+-ATPase subunit I/STV1
MNFTKFYIIFLSLIFAFHTKAADDIKDHPREKSKHLKNNWEVVSDIKSTNEPTVTGAQVNAVKNKKIKNILVKRVRKDGDPLLKVENENESFVVYNAKRNISGTVSGMITVKFKADVDIERALQDYPVNIVHIDSVINTAFVKVRKDQNIEEVMDKLNTDSKIERSNLEVTTKLLRAK